MTTTKHKPSNIDLPSNKQLEKVVSPYSDQKILELSTDEKIKKLMEFFDHYGIDYSKFKPEFRSFIEGKRAYPNYDQYINIPGQHDMKKWLVTVKDIHYKKKAGFEFKDAVRQATQGWKKMEIYDFLNWLRFHEEGSHMKYKFAQVWYENGQPGYFLHIKPDAQPAPESAVDGNAVNDAREEAERHEEKRSTIEKQRQKIIGRLDSAEKLLRSPEGQQFAGVELENLMEAIYSLKKKVQLVNKLSVSTRLYEDMIVREANVLSRKGFTKAANMLYSVAQTPGQAGQDATGTTNTGAMPPPAPPADPSGAGNPGAPGGAPATVPGVPDVNTPVGQDQNKDQPPAAAIMSGGNVPTGTAESSPALVPQEAPQPKGISEFIENMNEGNKTEESKADDLEVFDHLEVSDPEEELMVSEAQAIPPAAPPGIPPAVLEDVPITDNPPPSRGNVANLPPPKAPGDAPSGAPDDEPLEVSEKDIPPSGTETPPPDTSEFDAKMDEMFSSVTIADIVAELEGLAKIFKVREIPRRISRVDMMLNGKGMSSFFPQLSEALSNALASNQYVSTRLDEILSKLRASMNTKDIDLEGGPKSDSPEISGIKGKLEQDSAKEKARKQMRKDQENVEMEGGKKETPQVEMGELAPPPPASAPVKGPPVARPLG